MPPTPEEKERWAKEAAEREAKWEAEAKARREIHFETVKKRLAYGWSVVSIAREVGLSRDDVELIEQEIKRREQGVAPVED